MIKIEIESEKVTVKSATSAKSGKPYDIHEQSAYAYLIEPESNLPQKHPVAMKIAFDKGQFPYKAGMYTVQSAVCILTTPSIVTYLSDSVPSVTVKVDGTGF